jgi:U3 small nucleolar RNA-associated protein 4
MDIHRCRFVPYPPQAINALAFAQPSDTSKRCPPDQRLAIGRANGDIEIWNPAKGLWSQETIFRGGKDRSIEGLAWTQDLQDESDGDEGNKEAGRLRLFSIGFSSAVTEWDLARGVPARHANGNFGAIWCLAAQPRWTPPRTSAKDDQVAARPAARHDQYLAAGCEDGTIVLFSTEDGDLRYLKTIAKPATKKLRILSLTWKDQNIIVAGCSDSNIRVYDIRNRQNIRNMSLGKSALGGNETLVWAVKCLANGTILSGDSAGDLKIWDSNNYSLVQRLHCHEADILDIATNASGTTVITGGADRRTVAYKNIAGENGDRSRRWAQVMHRRFHEHDVKALASFESQELSIVVSGGLDTAPVVVPFRAWQKEYHRTLSHLPQSPQISSALESRLFISWWERQVSIWHLSRHAQVPELSKTSTNYSENHTLLAQVMLKGEENITSARISKDGKLLAVATVSNVKVFQLRLKRSPSDGRINLRTKKLESLPALERFGARFVVFSPDCRWLCSVRWNNEIVLVRIENTSGSRAAPQLSDQVIKLHRAPWKTLRDPKSTGLGEYLDSITNISFSADGRLFAVGDLSGRIATWVLDGQEQKGNGVVNGIVKHRGSESPKSADTSSSSSDESSSEDEDDSTLIHGQRWRKNPAGAYLPSLTASILVMSFRPSKSESERNTANSQAGLHPTRHNPHPHSHGLATDEDRLIVVTAEHRVMEFRVLGGILSDWSRRNPPSYLPRQFQQIRERAMGCFWDVSKIHERLWLYGSTWMFMLDLAQNLALEKSSEQVGKSDTQQPQQSSQENKKRKREVIEAEKLRNRGSGAGGTVSFSESYVGVGSHVRKFRSSKQEDSQMIQLDASLSPTSDEDEGSRLGSTALAQLRRGEQESDQQPVVNGQAKRQVNGTVSPLRTKPQSSAHQSKNVDQPASFLTLKYRSILGIVPIGGGSDQDRDRGDDKQEVKAGLESGLEVAIVERPLWDVELPPRFDGGQDWET